MVTRKILFLMILLFNLCRADGLRLQYDFHCAQVSDINEHLPRLRELSRQCGSVTEIGIRDIVSTWGLLQGLSESAQKPCSYVGIDLVYPSLNSLFLADELAESHGISFQFWQANDFDIDIEPTDLLFIDSWHSYRHLSYELEKFCPQVRKFIAMHDTSEPWGDKDEPFYLETLPEYPLHIDRYKVGLWAAVEDFLGNHPDWHLKERHFNNHGLTVLERR